MHFDKTIREKYLSGESNQFLLYGNVRDNYPFGDKYLTLGRYLESFFKASNKIVINFNISSGISFPSVKDKFIVKRAYIENDSIGGSKKSRESWFDKVLLESAIYPQVGIKFFKELLSLSIVENEEKRYFSIIFDYSEAMFPNAPFDRLNDSDRQKLVALLEWLTAQEFINTPHITTFISQTKSAINKQLLQLPVLTPIYVPLPNLKVRQDFIRYQYHKMKKIVKIKGSQIFLAKTTAGLSLKSIHHLFLSAKFHNKKINTSEVFEEVNELLQKELGEAISIHKPSHSLKDVIGAKRLKEILKKQKQLIQKSDSNVCPVGILVSGPNGVGKTFIFEAFASEIGYTVVRLKKIRSQWFGETDVIFEKVKSVLTSLGKVIVFIDEADTALGGRGSSTHETEKRLFGNIIQLMGDPSNRGKIIWMLLTARPDKLEPDIKRSGRAGLHLPVFDPINEERIEFISWNFKRIGINWKALSDKKTQDKFVEITQNYSPSDFNEWRSFIESEQSLNNTALSLDDVLELTQEFIPADLAEQRRLQTLLAAKECSYKSLLPLALHNMDGWEQELDYLKRKYS